MSLFVKTKMYQDSLLRVGQLVFKSVEGSALKEGFYVVADVGLKKENNIYGYDVVLREAEICEGVWKVGERNFKEYISKEDLNLHFGVGKEAAKGILSQYIKDVFRKSKRIDDFDDSVNYDKMFTGVARGVFRKFSTDIPEDVREDLVMDALMQSVNIKSVKKYDSSKSIISYFAVMFSNKIKTVTGKWVKWESKKKEDYVDEEGLDQFERMENKDLESNPGELLEYKELVGDLVKYLGKLDGGKYLVSMFELLGKGLSSKEIAPKLGISAGMVSRYYKRLMEGVKDFAQKVNNVELENSVKFLLKKKNYAANNFILDLEKEYKNRVGGVIDVEAGREPVGDRVKIERKNIRDKSVEDYLNEGLFEKSNSQKNFNLELEDFLALLDQQDEMIQEEDLIGLRVLDSEVRDFDKSSEDI